MNISAAIIFNDPMSNKQMINSYQLYAKFHGLLKTKRKKPTISMFTVGTDNAFTCRRHYDMISYTILLHTYFSELILSFINFTPSFGILPI